MNEPTFTVDADGGRVRKLLKPIRSHTGQIAAIRLRPPRYADVMALGDPSALIIMDGAVLPTQDMGIVKRYVETLAQDGDQPINAGLLEQLDYRDAIALGSAVMDFFKAASASTSTASSTPSSSSTASIQPASSE